MSSYHNTLNLPDTSKKETRCRTQEEYILSIFDANPDQGFTAAEIWEIIIDLKMVELTDLANRRLIDALKRGREINSSVRRGITNLMNQGHLEKTKQVRGGNSVYKLI